jgi:hypothetical protein
MNLVLALLPLAVEAPAPLLTLRDALPEKNFYLLTQLERATRVVPAVEADPALRDLFVRRMEQLRSAAGRCAADVNCHQAVFRWTEGDVVQAGDALAALAASSAPFRAFVAELRASRVYEKYADLDDAAYIRKAWVDCGAGINRVLDYYALGKPPRYAAIDSATYDVKSPNFGRLVNIGVQVLEEQSSGWRLFFQPSLRFAVQLMRAHHRDEAARFEPMTEGENRAAYQQIRKTDWKRYPNTVIVVPGSGLERPEFALSAWGRLRLELAAQRYRDGKAPFIRVSGGYVHPNQTRFNEALEMKKALLAEFGIPESAILIDPHARHTTTNLRNAARIIFRYGIPPDKPSLITTDVGQSAGIESDLFRLRCERELGYQPHKLLKRLGKHDLEWLPLPASLYHDPIEPLDP